MRSTLTGLPIALRMLSCLLARLSFGWRFEIHSRPTRLRQSDRDGLLGRTDAVFAFPHVMDFFADEFACLRGW